MSALPAIVATAPDMTPDEAPFRYPQQRVVEIDRVPRSWVRRASARLGRIIGGHRWRRRLAAFGRNSEIARPAWIEGGSAIVIGADVRIWRFARIEALSAIASTPRIEIGDGTVIQPHVHIGAIDSVRIGIGVLIASHVYITDHDHDWSDPDDPVIGNRRAMTAPVEIGDFVWLGQRVMVLKGVRIGPRSIIGAGSIVTKDIPPYCIAVGSPARVVRRFDPDTRLWNDVSS